MFGLALEVMVSAQEVTVGGNRDRWPCLQFKGHTDPSHAKENKYNGVGNSFFFLPCSLLKFSHLLQGQFNKIREKKKF